MSSRQRRMETSAEGGHISEQAVAPQMEWNLLCTVHHLQPYNPCTTAFLSSNILYPSVRYSFNCEFNQYYTNFLSSD